MQGGGRPGSKPHMMSAIMHLRVSDVAKSIITNHCKVKRELQKIEAEDERF